MAESVGHQLGGDVHDLDHAVVWHAGRTNHTQSPHHLAIYLIRGADDRELFKRYDLALAADVNAYPFRLA